MNGLDQLCLIEDGSENANWSGEAGVVESEISGIGPQMDTEDIKIHEYVEYHVRISHCHEFAFINNGNWI